MSETFQHGPFKGFPIKYCDLCGDGKALMYLVEYIDQKAQACWPCFRTHCQRVGKEIPANEIEAYVETIF